MTMSRRAITTLSANLRPTVQANAGAAVRWSSTAPRKAEGQPSRSIKDSTSAIDYKMNRPSRALPQLVRSQRNVTAEEAVTNILYNTPPPSTEPFKRHRLNCLVQNEPGVLSRVSGILAGRGFNIDSLVVCQTEIRDLSRMCIILKGQDGVIEQARRQLEDLVPVWAVLDYTNTRCVERELLLAKVSTLGPEFAQNDHSDSATSQTAYDQAIDQTAAPPSFVANDGSASASDETLAEKEAALARSFESSSNPLYPSRRQTDGMSPSEALIAKNLHFNAIKTLAEQFGGRIVDVGENDCIVQLTAKSLRVNAFLNLMRTFGVLEAARSGVMVLPRSPIPNHLEEEEQAERTEVDVSLLPPG